jgi:DNA-directed RNA polymerase specialized sigma subunit
MIRQEYKHPYNQTELGEKYGIGQDNISRIINNKIWEGK